MFFICIDYIELCYQQNNIVVQHIHCMSFCGCQTTESGKNDKEMSGQMFVYRCVCTHNKNMREGRTIDDLRRG